MGDITGIAQVALSVRDVERATIFYRDTGAAAGRLAGRRARHRREPHVVARMGDREVSLAVFRDPDRNPLHLMSEQPAR